MRKNIFINSIVQSIKVPLLLLVLGLIATYFYFFRPFAENKYMNHIINYSDEAAYVLLTLSGLLLCYKLVSKILEHYKVSFLNSKKIIAGHILSIAQNGWSIVFLLIAFNVVLKVTNLSPDHMHIVNNITLVLIIGAIAWILLRILDASEAVVYQNSLAQADRKYQNTYTRIHILKRIFTIIIVVLAAAAILMVFEKIRSIGVSILASAGFLTAIVALASQKTLGSLFAGIQLAFAESIRIGDVVTIENQTGIVEEITLNYVLINLEDARRYIIPVSYFLDKPFVNWSTKDDSLTGDLKVWVDASVSISFLREQLQAIVENSSHWDNQTVGLTISDMKDNKIEVKIAISASSPGALVQLQSEVREKLLELLHVTRPL